MIKGLSFSRKLLLTIMAIVLVSTGITTYLIQDKSFQSSKKSADKYLNALIRNNAYESKEDLNKAIVISYGFSASLETFLKNKLEYSKDDIPSRHLKITLQTLYKH